MDTRFRGYDEFTGLAKVLINFGEPIEMAMDNRSSLQQAVRMHYENHVYPQFPLLLSVRRCDTYALNLDALWARFNGQQLGRDKKILLAGCGSFSPYPTAVANQQAEITALDLSRANLHRAKLHTWLHGYFNVNFIEGDLVGSEDFLGKNSFRFIDCYGVLHHIPDVSAALQSIHDLLVEGGFARIMVYSACARRPANSIKKAMQILNINDVKTVKKLCQRAKKGSRFKDYMDSSNEFDFDSGLADMFLHPYAKTYQIEELLSILDQAGLEPLLFAHYGALAKVSDEIKRLNYLEATRQLRSNFMVYVGRKQDALMRTQWEDIKNSHDTVIALNPVIKKSLWRLPLLPFRPEPKLGFENPPIDFKGHLLLSKFRNPLRKSLIGLEQRKPVKAYLAALFLIELAAWHEKS